MQSWRMILKESCSHLGRVRKRGTKIDRELENIIYDYRLEKRS